MPNTYYPNGTIPIPGTSAASAMSIALSTDTSPIEVQTVNPHGLSTGDNVEIVGHAANTSANGVWQITVLGASTLYLNGSVGVAGGGTTGNMFDCTVDPSFTLPSGGDNVTAASVNMFAEGCANAIPFLYLRTGKYRFVDQYYADNSLAGTPWVNWGGTPGTTGIAAANTPQKISNGIFGGTFPGYGNPPGLAPGDVLDITLMTAVVVVSGTSYAAPTFDTQIGIGISTDTIGATLVSGSLQTANPGNGSWAAASNYCPAVCLRNLWVPPNPFHFASFDIYAFGNIYSASVLPASGITIRPAGRFSCIVNHYRPTAAQT
jgi:hypothetical protein